MTTKPALLSLQGDRGIASAVLQDDGDNLGMLSDQLCDEEEIVADCNSHSNEYVRDCAVASEFMATEYPSCPGGT